jgi:MFS family permease
LRDLLALKTLWLFAVIYLLIVTGVYGINFWLPSIIQQTGVGSMLSIGLVTALSYFVAAVLAVLVARHAERHNEKRWHAAGAAAVGGAALALSAAFADSTWLTVACVTLASAGGLVSMSLFWSFPGSILVGAGVAAGLAAVNSVGNLGGFVGPYLLGGLTDWLGSSTAGIAVLGGVMVAAGALIAATCQDYGIVSARSPQHGH